MADKKDWETTTERFVAFFDIMGFKELVHRREHEEIVNLLVELSKGREMLENNNNRSGKRVKKLGETISFTFSDTIVFFSKGNSEEDFTKIFVDCAVMLVGALNLKIPIKGAMSYGKITLDQSKAIFFGQPIIDAYTLHDELLMYSVIIDNEVEKRIENCNAEAVREGLVFYKAPMKSGRIRHKLIRPYNLKEHLETLNKLYSESAGRPRLYIDNTIEYIESLIKNEVK